MLNKICTRTAKSAPPYMLRYYGAGSPSFSDRMKHTARESGLVVRSELRRVTLTKLYRRAVMCNSQVLRTIDSSSKNISTQMTISVKNDTSDFENVPLLVNFAKWNNNEN